MAQADKTSDAQIQKAIARAVGIATAQFRQELDLQDEKQRRVVSELQTAVAQLQAQVAAMSVKTERTAGTQMPPPAPPAPPPPPPPPRSTVETSGAMMRRHAAAETAGKGENECGEAAPRMIRDLGGKLRPYRGAWDDPSTTDDGVDSEDTDGNVAGEATEDDGDFDGDAASDAADDSDADDGW